MTPASVKPLTLEEFLKLPYIEESPAWEYINGDAIQKPMPKTRHSILQKRLLAVIDSNTEDYTHFLNFVVPLAGVLLYLMLQWWHGTGFSWMRRESQKTILSNPQIGQLRFSHLNRMLTGLLTTSCIVCDMAVT
jgi:hypothetical protein